MYEITEEMEKSIDHLSNALNNFNTGDQIKLFFELFTRKHRTLQQNFFRMLCQFIIDYSEQKYYDDRNLDSINFCKKLKAYIIKNDLNYFRYV